MKILKTFLFVLFAFLIANISQASAATVTGSVTVTVIPSATQYTITASGDTGCIVSPSGSIPVSSGGSLTISLSAVAGYTVSSMTTDGVGTSLVKPSVTFSNVTSNHAFSAHCVPSVAVSCPGGQTNPPACNSFVVCPAPTTQIVKVACDPNSKEEAAISGLVTRSQTKVAPNCTFGVPITRDNSIYITDNCVYPTSSVVPTPPSSGNSDPVVVTPPPVATPIDGGWTSWTPARSNVCMASGTQTRSCTNPAPSNGGASCSGPTTQDYVNTNCPSVNIKATLNDKSILPDEKVPYNSLVKISWASTNTTSCSCSYLDINGNRGSCGSGTNSSFLTKPPIKKDTTYTVSCNGSYGMTDSDSVKVLVDPISAGYIEY